jgi:hypothetical protein
VTAPIYGVARVKATIIGETSLFYLLTQIGQLNDQSATPYRLRNTSKIKLNNCTSVIPMVT